MAVTHKRQESHDLQIPYTEWRVWVQAHTGVALPRDPTDVLVEITSPNQINVHWQGDWTVQPMELPVKDARSR